MSFIYLHTSLCHAKNYDSVFFFDVDNASMDKEEEKEEGVKVKAHFSFSYKEDQCPRPNSGWDWAD